MTYMDLYRRWLKETVATKSFTRSLSPYSRPLMPLRIAFIGNWSLEPEGSGVCWAREVTG